MAHIKYATSKLWFIYESLKADRLLRKPRVDLPNDHCHWYILAVVLEVLAELDGVLIALNCIEEVIYWEGLTPVAKVKLILEKPSRCWGLQALKHFSLKIEIVLFGASTYLSNDDSWVDQKTDNTKQRKHTSHNAGLVASTLIEHDGRVLADRNEQDYVSQPVTDNSAGTLRLRKLIFRSIKQLLLPERDILIFFFHLFT